MIPPAVGLGHSVCPWIPVCPVAGTWAYKPLGPTASTPSALTCRDTEVLSSPELALRDLLTPRSWAINLLSGSVLGPSLQEGH